MKKVYGIISDSGDGSSSIYWFKDSKIADMLLDDDSEYVEQFGCNEGGYAEELTFPDDVDLQQCGFSFSDNDYK